MQSSLLSLLEAYLETSIEHLNTKQALQPTVTQPKPAQLMSEATSGV